MAHKFTNIGKYERRNLLGGGSFGQVYDAYDRALNARRALKVIHSKNPQRLFQMLSEARILEICKHKHVVEVKEADIQKVDGDLAVVISTELLQGGSAQKLLDREFVNPARTLKIIRDSLFGLEHLHVNGVVHCDIKPANILLTRAGVAKLSDFGLAIRVKAGDLPKGVYNFHMAPESTHGIEATEHADIYAIGVTLYRLINNIADFRNLAPPNVVSLIRRGRFPNRNAYRKYVPTKVKRIANRAMRVDKAKRYQSATQVRQALERLSINFDWQRIDSTEWCAEKVGDEYTLRALPTNSHWRVEFRKNGRRKTQHCRGGFTSNWEAEAYLEKVVAATLLE